MKLVQPHVRQLTVVFVILFGLLFALRGDGLVDSPLMRLWITLTVLLYAFVLVPGPVLQNESEVV